MRIMYAYMAYRRHYDNLKLRTNHQYTVLGLQTLFFSIRKKCFLFPLLLRSVDVFFKSLRDRQ